jgi:endonuclease YncB( thermonuclease family)
MKPIMNRWRKRRSIVRNGAGRRAVAGLVAGLACCACFAAPAAADTTGKARALAGDRLEISGVALQLFGIDAPEPDQACLRAGQRWDCGFAATAALAYRTAGQWVTCVEQGADAAGTPLALCYLGGLGGPEVNGWMISAGWGVADQPPLFAEGEAAAREAGRGIWASTFVPPADWRLGQRLPIEAAASDGDGLCSIKGDLDAQGERTYHLPGGAFYPGVAIDPSRGERWFCDEAEALAAGWTRSAR